MDNKKFAHLHVHTEYSLLDGSAKIKELVKRAKELNMDSLAITDHGVMYGIIKFYKEALRQGIKPILGCEVYVAMNSRLIKEANSDGNYYHLVLLAENNEGYNNLLKLVSLGFEEGFYYKPRVDVELLRKYSKGIIALSACIGGQIPRLILQSNYEKAKETAILYKDIFGEDNFFLELQDHGLYDQKIVNQALIKMGKETNIKLVASNDSHYINKEDAQAHDILLCIQTLKTIDDEDRMKFEGSEFYLKSPEEMYDIFSYAKEACENTVEIAKRCNVEIKFHETKLPKYNVPEGFTSEKYFKKLCNDGLIYRYETITDEIQNRLDYEISVITGMGYVDYYLIVWDFIKFARDNGIPVGPGRGSGAASIAAYCLQITDVDPIKYNLLFERFLNPERISMPDFDIDFCFERRQEVIDYCINKYNADHVAQIITFGTMAARAVIRDVGRALAISYSEVDKVAKMIPVAIGITIDKALDMNPELLDLYKANETIKKLIDMSKRLEGLPRHASTHAAGVLICDKPVVEYVPLYSNDGVISTQFDMVELEELGLLKMDFLGLRTLTVIQKAIDEIYKNTGETIDFHKDDYSDKKVFETISAGKTEGIFQLESAGMIRFMKDLTPSSLEDIIAGVALYRPGPMDFIPKYVYGKKNPDDIKYTHGKLEPILNTTYGCIIYQEQVMQIVRDLAGYSLGRSDLVRRAMSKKKTDVMEKERHNFVYGGDEVPGCIKQGIPKDTAEKIFDEMIDFAKYAFNKAHSSCYAVLAYQTAWLKVYYPVEYMAAIMTSVMGFASKVTEYINECKKMDIAIVPPDINESYRDFSVSGNKIRFGLAAIKNVGRPIIEAIMTERKNNSKFTSFTDFCTRLDGKDLNKRCIESLIKAGAFDSLGGNRKQYMIIYKQIIDGIGIVKKRNIAGQLNLFEMNLDETELPKETLPNEQEYPLQIILAMEKEVLGIYVSGHPLAPYEEKLNKYTNAKSIDFSKEILEQEEDTNISTNIRDGANVTIGGLIIDKQIKYTKSNKTMAFIKIEDMYGVVEAMIFPQTYDSYSTLLQIEKVVIIEGKVSLTEDEDGKVISNVIFSYDDIDSVSISSNNENTNLYKKRLNVNTELNPKEVTSDLILWLKIKQDKKRNLIDGINFILEAYQGKVPVYIVDEITGKRYKAASRRWVSGEQQLVEDLKEILGDDAVVLKQKAN